MSELDIRLVPLLRDNYGYLIREPESGKVGIVDPSEARPVLEMAQDLGWRITHIFNTHHHPDHTGGNREIKRATDATVVGPKPDQGRIPEIDVALDDGDIFDFGEARAEVIFVPGHTRGHIAFHFPESRAVFSGDTLFLMGCGRLFEGSPEQMWRSLRRLRDLPPDTRVFCGHEYTQSNARFALSVEPQNAALKARAKRVDDLRAADKPTIPGTMEEERATNPFLRADEPSLAEAIGMAGREPVEIFAEVRHRKDSF
jgi:hydroxyacylglutathione hydrolase